MTSKKKKKTIKRFLISVKQVDTLNSTIEIKTAV